MPSGAVHPNRKPGLKLSLWDEILPEVRAAVERRQACALQKGARRAQARRLDLRLSAFCLPSLQREEKSKWRVVDSEGDFPNSRLAIDQAPTRIALRE
jgi:hypothetical protein